MLRNAARDIIAQRLGNRTDLNDLIISEMQLQQETLEQSGVAAGGGNFLPWFLLTEVTGADCTAEEERLPLPRDFLQEYEYGTLWLYDSSDSSDPWKEMVKSTWDTLKEELTGTGVPSHYALVGNQFRLKKTPDAAYTFKMVYYATDTVLDSDITNQWLTHAPALLIAVTGVQIAKYIQNPRLSQVFAMDAAQQADALYKAHVRREVANMPMQMRYK